MSTKSKTLAKSLHTVSAIVSVAKALRDRTDHAAAARDWVEVALSVLGYADASDPYGLRLRAAAILEGGK